MLQLGLYDTSAGSLILDASPRASSVVVVTGEHGFSTLTCFVKMALWEAFLLYDRPGLPDVRLTEFGLTVWQGRLEDVAIVAGGVRLTALGYWRALSDAPYTALWISSRVSDWRAETADDVGGFDPHMYAIDTNNRLYIGLTKGSVYGNLANTGGLTYGAPNGGARTIKQFSCTYAVLLPTNWIFQLVRCNEDFSGRVAITTITGNGALQTGTISQTFTGMNRLEVSIYNQTGANYTMNAETGAFYIKLTGLQVQSQSAFGNVGADQIAWDLIAATAALNPTQLSASLARVNNPGVSLTDEIYQDAYPADILDRLAKLGDSSTPPALFETGVWEGQLLSFQKRGATARTWYVDITALELERTIDQLYNSAYADFQEAAGRTLRTATNSDNASVARYGLTRRRMVTASTTLSSEAATQRDAALQDGKDPRPRITIAFDRVYDAAGSPWPLWAPRAWDTMVIRNLPATLSAMLDRIRQFRVIEISFDVDAGVLTVTPEQFTPSLDVMVARSAAGIHRRGEEWRDPSGLGAGGWY